VSASSDAPRVPEGAAPSPGLALDAQTLSDRDQTAADWDQTESDLDHTTADVDRGASERDQVASDRDQEAADDDQHASDRAGVNREGYARTRRARSQSAVERDHASEARSQTARLRDEAGVRRDRAAAERDVAAQARDRLAAAIDREIERFEYDDRENGHPVGIDALLRRKDAAASRVRAAAQRETAAKDRADAARDRLQAAVDRADAVEELIVEGIDDLTGALRRRVGLDAIQREIDRTTRTGERLVLAFIDVDGLKPLNDQHGHGAGDELLRETVRSIREHLRSYDVITRVGGDEFLCSLAGQDTAGARKRFDEISIQSTEGPPRASFTVGFAEKREGESLEDLVGRADLAMLQARKRPTGRPRGANASSNGAPRAN
jgi:diguanylate cyclase (GGDEF)-like protein